LPPPDAVQASYRHIAAIGSVRQSLRDETVRSAFLSAAMGFAGMAVPACAEELQCVGDGGRFEIGQYACLSAGDQSHLARCQTNLNIPTWAVTLDHCPGGLPPPSTQAIQCRANGQLFPPGSFACLTISGNQRLARCDEVLNNSSWTTVQAGCPGGPLPEAPAKPAKQQWLRDALALPKRLFDRLLDRL
jgi:hypothetical protein